MIRLYGHSLGYASFAQVTRGFRRAAEAMKLLAGFVAVDDRDYDDLDPPAGAAAPVAVNCGAPGGVLAAKTMGHHAERWLMLAPNSDKIPPRIEAELLGFVTGLLTPSAWGKEVLDHIFDGRVPVRVCQHGVMPEFVPHPKLHEALIDTYGARPGRGVAPFHVGHFTSTNSERKGTRELLRAWKRVEQDVAPGAVLSIYCQHRGAREIEDWAAELGLHRVLVQGSMARPAQTQNALYQRHHLIVQPSRAEGFGLVPLEARAAGVPVAATACTGHADHVGTEIALGAVHPSFWAAAAPAGVVVIASGDDGPMDDLPGASAPTVRQEDVADAIQHAYISWRDLHDEAVESAEAVRKSWSWEARTGPVLRKLVEEAKA